MFKTFDAAVDESCDVMVARSCDIDVVESFAIATNMSCDRETAEFGSVGSGSDGVDSVELKSEEPCGGDRMASLDADGELLMMDNGNADTRARWRKRWVDDLRGKSARVCWLSTMCESEAESQIHGSFNTEDSRQVKGQLCDR